jgi:hypothetical protein
MRLRNSKTQYFLLRRSNKINRGRLGPEGTTAGNRVEAFWKEKRVNTLCNVLPRSMYFLLAVLQSQISTGRSILFNVYIKRFCFILFLEVMYPSPTAVAVADVGVSRLSCLTYTCHFRRDTQWRI